MFFYLDYDSYWNGNVCVGVSVKFSGLLNLDAKRNEAGEFGAFFNRCSKKIIKNHRADTVKPPNTFFKSTEFNLHLNLSEYWFGIC